MESWSKIPYLSQTGSGRNKIQQVGRLAKLSAKCGSEADSSHMFFQQCLVAVQRLVAIQRSANLQCSVKI